MSESWCDWPILGAGWKRRTVMRKSGASCGHSDTYYLSPTGERIRSKNELSKFFGESVDLSLFHFKEGVMLTEDKPRKTPKKPVLSPKPPGEPHAKKQRLSSSITPTHLQYEDSSDVVCCRGCNVWFTSVEFGKSKQMMRYCGDCRASKKALNKQQRLLKNTGCGTCSACKLSENCGYCTVCLLRLHNPEFGSSWKCVKRRCLQVLRKGSDCGNCEGCCATEDCDACAVCLSREEVTGDEVREKCLKRRCLNKKPEKQSAGLKEVKTKKPSIKWKPLSLKVKHKKKNNGNKLKAAFEKQRMKEKNIPLSLKSTNHPVLLERIKQEAALEVTVADEEVPLPVRVPVIRLERLEQQNGSCVKDINQSWAINNEFSKEIKQEFTETTVIVDTQEEPLDLHCSVRTNEFIAEDDDVEEADESTPVIMEIFSLGSYNSTTGLDRVLQEFLSELHEIPLPAHWEVLSQTGPNLQLVQRSSTSTMAETIIHIQPGLHFDIVVRNYTVPSIHPIFSDHPSRLTTVDEVVELICDLEAYRPCAGLPKGGPRSPNCLVLVREKRCPECRINPWPLGSVL